MNDEMDVLFDRRLRGAFQAVSLPPAPATLREALDDLPTTSAVARQRPAPRLAMAAVAASVAVVAFLGWAANFGGGNLGGPGGVQTPTSTPSPSPSPTPAPSAGSATLDAFGVAQLLDGRAAGSIGSDAVILFGWYSDFRGSAQDPCPTPPGAELELNCRDERQGVLDADAGVGAFVDGSWLPTGDRTVHPYWPPAIMSDPPVAALFAVTPPAGLEPRPIFVMLRGHFDDPLAAACAAAAAPSCADRFVVEQVIQFDDPYLEPTPAPSATPFPFDSLPPPPTWIAGEACSGSRATGGAREPGDPVDPGFRRAGWIPRTEIPYEMPFGYEVLQDIVYYVEIQGDFPLGGWRDAAGDATGDPSDDFRWWGTATCAADENGVFPGWIPGTTYRLYRDGRRVDGGDPFDPLPSPTAAP